ncbi:unnamed protein product [Nippostrongylus brasiliensis]|uniref:Coat protein n=1 Tax=Nippostrongylus brasiliensis TaxID=27835 RepID=A0A0N4XEV3_NIPBR|nr:unnamed protein product [Nippostrongylus brasiliensis]
MPKNVRTINAGKNSRRWSRNETLASGLEFIR